MGTYFSNKTLDQIWTNILTSTVDLCGDIGGTGFKHVHNALLLYTGLERDILPTTLGDYLVGICKCAKKIGGDTHDSKIGLARVAELLQNPVSHTTIISVSGHILTIEDDGEYGYMLYINNSAFDTIYEKQLDLSTLGLEGGTYEIYVVRFDSDGEPSSQSNTVEYCVSYDVASIRVHLSEDGYVSVSSDSIISSVDYRLYCVIDGVWEEISYKESQGDSYDFSQIILQHGESSYYVECLVIMQSGYSETIDSNTITIYGDVEDTNTCEYCGAEYHGDRCTYEYCPTNMVDCPECGEWYSIIMHDHCPNNNCATNAKTCPECGTEYTGEECTNDFCPAYMVTCPECGETYSSYVHSQCPNNLCPSNGYEPPELQPPGLYLTTNEFGKPCVRIYSPNTSVDIYINNSKKITRRIGTEPEWIYLTYDELGMYDSDRIEMYAIARSSGYADSRSETISINYVVRNKTNIERGVIFGSPTEMNTTDSHYYIIVNGYDYGFATYAGEVYVTNHNIPNFEGEIMYQYNSSGKGWYWGKSLNDGEDENDPTGRPSSVSIYWLVREET